MQLAPLLWLIEAHNAAATAPDPQGAHTAHSEGTFTTAAEQSLL